MIASEAEHQLVTLIARIAPSHGPMIASLRSLLRKRLPTAIELVYEYRDCVVISYSPNEHGYEGVLGIRASENEVRLFFNRWQELHDPAKLLKGSGKQVRAIPVPSAASLADPAVASLIDQAIALNPVPFASTGQGSVVIRPTSASKRRA